MYPPSNPNAPETPGHTDPSRGQVPSTHQPQPKLHINLPSRTEIDRETSSINQSFDDLLQTLHRLLHNTKWTYSIGNAPFALRDDRDMSNEEMRQVINQLESEIEENHRELESLSHLQSSKDEASREMKNFRQAKQQIVPLLETLITGRGRINFARQSVRKYRTEMGTDLAGGPSSVGQQDEEVFTEIRQLFDKTEDVWKEVLDRADVIEGVVLSLRLHVLDIHLQRLQNITKT